MNEPIQYRIEKTTKPSEFPAQETGGRSPSIEIGLMNLQGFELTQRAAKLLAASSLVPKEYQEESNGVKGIANCVIALNMAARMNADPLMVMQNLHIVNGRPSLSSQFLIATFNKSGRYSTIKYKWTGRKGDPTWGCKAFATEKETGGIIESAEITWDIIQAEGWDKRTGSKWRTIPEQMFMYRAASWLVRAYAPEISMGLHTVEENFDQAFDAYRNNNGSFIVAQPSEENSENTMTLSIKKRGRPPNVKKLEDDIEDIGSEFIPQDKLDDNAVDISNAPIIN